jgi:Fe-S-cluster containining protein
MTGELNCSICKSHCCGRNQTVGAPIVLPKEISNFSDDDLYEDGGVKRIKRGSDGMCKFLSNKLCSIYERRPLECRLYPWIMVYTDGKVGLELHKGCEQHSRVDPFDPKEEQFWKDFPKASI